MSEKCNKHHDHWHRGCKACEAEANEAASSFAEPAGSVATLVKPIVAYGQVFPVGTVIAGLKLSQKDYWCGRLDGYYVSHIPPDYFQCD